ncbi:MAG: type II secretory pathway predicted ATPase ExeA [Desulforhopalus sp.]|jgi:type II secretory pathway predicted ATPase ExeA
MYLSYYKLNKKPFQISTDPNFFWLGEKHKEALSILKYGVMDDKGFLLLTGDVGTGKTTLINTFVNSLGDDVIVSRVSDPGLTQLDFINYIAKLFKIETGFETKSEFLILFTEFLEQAHEDDKKVLLIIDEAQHLTDETLEEIRLLSNIENQDKKLLNIFLVGQNEFNETLEKHKNRALSQRLTLNYTLYPFDAEETKACIKYRLRVAGAEDEIFEPEAIDVIHTISNGFPRVINIICDHALRLGCQEDQEIISAAIVNQCSKTLHVAHRPPSNQHGSHFGSANEWLEESEVPPLSPEAIDRVSQPLPDFIIDNEDDIKEKVRSYNAIVPLFIAALLTLGFFLFKEGNLDSVSKFLTTLNKDVIISTAKEKRNDFLEIVQQIEKSVFSETIPASSIAPSHPAEMTKSQKKQVFKVNISEEFTKTEIPEIDSRGSNQKQQTITITEMVKVAAQPGTNAPTGPITSSDKLDDVDAKILQQEPEPSFTQIPTNTEKPIVDEPESSKMTEVLTDDVQEEENVEAEVIAEPPIPPVSGTPAIIEKDIEKEKQSAPQSKVESVPKDIDSTVVQNRVRPEPQTPTPPTPPTSTAKETSDTNDDPGAVIDWLLKSKQN